MSNLCDCKECTFGDRYLTANEMAEKLGVGHDFLYQALYKWEVTNSTKYATHYKGQTLYSRKVYLRMKELFVGVTTELNKIRAMKKTVQSLKINLVIVDKNRT